MSQHLRTASPRPSRGEVWFVGAGPGAPDLLTLRGARLLSTADLVLWADSLIDPAIMDLAPPHAPRVATSSLTLEDIAGWYATAAHNRWRVVRLHSGDPTLYSTIAEQAAVCRALGLHVGIVPGVSAVTACAAAAGVELTAPGGAQTVIVTRAPGRTPTREQLPALARHRATMVLLLSARHAAEVQRALLEGGYPPETPCAVVVRASWPDEAVRRCTLVELADTVRATGARRQLTMLVGDALDGPPTRSRLYDPNFAHLLRRRADR